MMLRTGSDSGGSINRATKGFTLLEVMVAAAVLAMGTVLIFQSYFAVLKAYDYCSAYMGSCAFAQEKLWQAAESVRWEGSLPVERGGEFTRGGKHFTWDVRQESAGGMLFKVTVAVKWDSGKQEREVERSAYAVFEKTG